MQSASVAVRYAPAAAAAYILDNVVVGSHNTTSLESKFLFFLRLHVLHMMHARTETEKRKRLNFKLIINHHYFR